MLKIMKNGAFNLNKKTIKVENKSVAVETRTSSKLVLFHENSTTTCCQLPHSVEIVILRCH